jgi:negative regulator of sigma E activity
MKELKNIINKYKDFDESAIKILLNQINEALKSQNYTLTSIKKCKRIIKNA